ncbi:MAG: RNA polymerase sigma factor [Verrucomicrobiales bacterium]
MDEPVYSWPDEIARVKTGDEAAARRLVESLYPKVVRIVRNHLPVTEDEEDMCQEVFMKMFSRLSQYRAEQPFDHWVARIALNTCLDKLRRQKVRRVRSFSDFSWEEAECLQDAMTAREYAESAPALTSVATLEVVEKLLATLKPAEQLVLRLLDLEERSVAEICAQTGWGASRVKVTAFRARRKLASTFKDLESASAI